MDTMSISGLEAKGKQASGAGKALVKGIAIIDAVALADRPARTAELVEATGLPRATVLRLIDVLLDEHVLQATGDGYALGSRLAGWGQRYLDGLDVRAAAEASIRRLADETRETCFVGIREGREVLYVAKADSPQPVRPASRVGSRNPLHSTGLGKALLAFSGREALHEYVAGGPLERRTPNTITDLEALGRELDATVARGYAVDDVENEEGVRCVAVPIRDHTGAVVAALSLVAPAYRFSIEDLPRLAPRVLEVGREISSRIGHRATDHGRQT
jgi:IclR family acetate operon transcriptional repressor